MDESPGKMYALATVLTILAIAAVLLRFYSRRIKKVHLSWDDYSVVLALVGTFAVIWRSATVTYECPLKRSPPSRQEFACLLVSIFSCGDIISSLI